MERIISTEKIPIKLWLDDIEPGAFRQAMDIANLHHAAHHVAIMPDCHQGFGMPIGGVLATREVVIPNAVGVDIGCGLCAVRTTLKSITPPDLKSITETIRRSIPVGFKHHKKPMDGSLMPLLKHKLHVVEREYESARHQLGTLGGGNHFIEIQRGSDGQIWIMVHSGSRNIGKQVADYYFKKAAAMNEKYFRSLKTPRQLAFLPVNSEEGKLYLKEMEYCVNFAFANRKLMVEVASGIIGDHLGDVEFSGFINIAHNYANKEKHFGEELMIHRKGATSAKKDEQCIIPGSQGSSSFIARGRGNPESFQSCSHGAGRVMGRKEAQRSLDLGKERKKLEEKGILHSVFRQKDLDEAAGAYKNIDRVMKLQADLVETIVELQPMAVIKG